MDPKKVKTEEVMAFSFAMLVRHSVVTYQMFHDTSLFKILVVPCTSRHSNHLDQVGY